MSGWYQERLEEEQEQLEAVNEAMDALDLDKFTVAVGKINNRTASQCAARLAGLKEIKTTLDTLAALQGFLMARIDYLTPLAQAEKQKEQEAQNRVYERSV